MNQTPPTEPVFYGHLHIPATPLPSVPVYSNPNYAYGTITKPPEASEAENITPFPSVLAEAEQLINGDRRQSYGDVQESFDKVAKVWSIIIGATVSKRQVALCMAGLKLCREVNAHKRDNLTDLAAYAELANQVAEG